LFGSALKNMPYIFLFKRHLVFHYKTTTIFILVKKKIKLPYSMIIIVDEFQDCTNTDFEIFFRLLKNQTF
jgi:hypothetical protein